MSTKIDLDELERKANAASEGEWSTRGDAVVWVDGEWELAIVNPIESQPDAQCRVDAVHIAANSPPVTLALVAYIRKLEGAVRSCVFGGTIPDAHSIDGENQMLALLEKGAVLT